MEDALYDSESIRRFAGIDLTAGLVPDETTILRFRTLTLFALSNLYIARRLLAPQQARCI